MNEKVIGAADLAALFQTRKINTHKGDFGYVALVGGSVEYSGAIRLAEMANAGVRSGAGVVSVVCPKEICPWIAPSILEATLHPFGADGKSLAQGFEGMPLSSSLSRYDVICFGMGIGKDSCVGKMLLDLLRNYKGILVLDADGLNALSDLVRDGRVFFKAQKDCSGLPDFVPFTPSPRQIILTPHFGEYKRLSSVFFPDTGSLDSPVSPVLFSKETGIVLLLKGPNKDRKETLITDGETVYLSGSGCSGMSTGGSGDVLSGIIAASLGRYPEDPLFTVAVACYLNGLAGEKAAEKETAISMTAKDTALYVREVIKDILKK